MSTTIKSNVTTRTLKFGASGLGGKEMWVQITLDGLPERDPILSVNRAEFLAAVEAECGVRLVPADAIVIERSELPEVTIQEPGYAGYVKINDRNFALRTIESYDDSIRDLIALREYAAAHPPVDAAQVEVLALLLVALDPIEHMSTTDIARRLYLAGVRIEATK